MRDNKKTLDLFRQNDWWYQDIETDVSYRFQHKDYIDKINELMVHISNLDSENKKLKRVLQFRGSTF